MGKRRKKRKAEKRAVQQPAKRRHFEFDLPRDKHGNCLARVRGFEQWWPAPDLIDRD